MGILLKNFKLDSIRDFKEKNENIIEASFFVALQK